MKKNILYSGLAMMTLALASCNGDYDDWAAPQTNPAENPAAAYGITLAAESDAVANSANIPDTLKLFSFNTTAADVNGYVLKSLVVDGTAEINAWLNGNTVEVLSADLEKAIREVHKSKAHAEYPYTLKATYDAVLANGDALLGEGEVAGKLTTLVTPAEDPNGYVMLGDFDGCGWNLANPIVMEKVETGIYKATVNSPSESCWFKFYEASKYSTEDWDATNSGQMGCADNGDASLFNYVVWTGDKTAVQTPVVAGVGSWDITLDVINMIYTIQRSEAKYYVVGVPNGWSTTDMSCMFYAEGGSVYSYTTSWSGAWDLKIWKAEDFGDWSKTYGGGNGDGSPAGTLIPGGDGAFQSPSAGYYTLTINMNDLGYTWTAVDASSIVDYTSVSLIGDFNGWGGDVDMAQLATAPHNWYVRYEVPTDGGLKFRANHDWAMSWGCAAGSEAISDVVYYTPTGSENITVPAGTYDFYLNDITGRFSIVKVTE